MPFLMYKEDYIISNSAERISPIISGSYYSSKPENFTAGETFGIPFSGEPLLAPPQEEECDVSESDARCRELGESRGISSMCAATCPARARCRLLSRTLTIPRYLLKRRNIINPRGTDVHFFVFQRQDRQTVILQHFSEWWKLIWLGGNCSV